MDKSKRENLTIRMSPNLRDALKTQAIKEKRSLSDLLEDGAVLYLQSLMEKQPA